MNFKFFIQLLETLLVELIEIHYFMRFNMDGMTILKI